MAWENSQDMMFASVSYVCICAFIRIHVCVYVCIFLKFSALNTGIEYL